MPDSAFHNSSANKKVIAVILGGGQGTRLFPLTSSRAKPAVPLAGKYRLVDIPISNCINSRLRKIYLLTQFNSASLHRHISQSYKFDHFSGGYIEIMAAEQTPEDTSWYQGTADAVRKNRIHFENVHDWECMLILSGDQLYRMDFQEILKVHYQNQADLTIATMPVPRAEVPSLGIMQIDHESRITRFVEKPKDPAVQDSLKLDRADYSQLHIQRDEDLWLASMGIYVFNKRIILDLLDSDHTDFGKHIIPEAINKHRVFSYVFQGYWQDIGTIRSFFEANLDCASELPHFDFFAEDALIFSRARYLPSSKINGAAIDHAVIADGCIITRAQISYSVIGLRSRIESGSYLRRTVLMGSDGYESAESIAEHERRGQPRVGVGKGTRIENCIIDKNARIGDNVVINPDGKPDNFDGPNDLYFIRDGIVIIPKNGVVPHNTII